MLKINNQTIINFFGNLLKIFYNNDVSLKDLLNKTEPFSTFYLRTRKKINRHLPIIILKESNKISSIPLLFSIIENPYIVFKTELFQKKTIRLDFIIYLVKSTLFGIL